MRYAGLETWLPVSIEQVIEDKYADTSPFGSRVHAAILMLSAGYTRESIREQHGFFVLREAVEEMDRRKYKR
jgi:hypothetical protein